MKARDTALKEVPCGHLAPAVIIGIADYITRKDEEKVYGKIAVVDDLLGSPSRISLKEMKRRCREESDKPSDDSYLYVKSGGKLMRINRKDIVYVKGMGEYVQIKLKGATHPIVTLESMHHYEEMLEPAGFIRVHRSYIVNMSHVDKASPGQIEIAGETFPIGSKYRANFKERFLTSSTKSL